MNNKHIIIIINLNIKNNEKNLIYVYGIIFADYFNDL